MFLNDGFGCSGTYESTLLLGTQVKQDLLCAGFIPKTDKCIWVPIQVVQFLGSILDSSQVVIQIASHRTDKAMATCSFLIEE